MKYFLQKFIALKGNYILFKIHSHYRFYLGPPVNRKIPKHIFQSKPKLRLLRF